MRRRSRLVPYAGGACLDGARLSLCEAEELVGEKRVFGHGVDQGPDGHLQLPLLLPHAVGPAQEAAAARGFRSSCSSSCSSTSSTASASSVSSSSLIGRVVVVVVVVIPGEYGSWVSSRLRSGSAAEEENFVVIVVIVIVPPRYGGLSCFSRCQNDDGGGLSEGFGFGNVRVSTMSVICVGTPLSRGTPLTIAGTPLP